MHHIRAQKTQSHLIESWQDKVETIGISKTLLENEADQEHLNAVNHCGLEEVIREVLRHIPLKSN